MATTYALPMNGVTTQSHGHTRSHHRRSPQERLPSQHSLIDGGTTSKEKPASSLHAHLHPHSHAEQSQSQRDFSKNQHFQTKSDVSIPDSGVEGHINGRAKGMEQLWNGTTIASRPQGDSYGFPIVDKNADRGGTAPGSGSRSLRAWLQSNEFSTSILMPLPYLLVSLAYPESSLQHLSQAAESRITHLTNSIFNEAIAPGIPLPSSPAGLSQACAVTCGTLLLLGFMGRIRASQNSLDRRKGSLGVAGDTERKPAKLGGIEGAKRIAGRLLSVGLPVYGSLKLGGGRTGLVMLVAGAGCLFSREGEKEDLTRIEGWKRLITSRKGTLVALAAGVICDVLGFTSTQAARSIALGYPALILSISVLPPPFSQRPTKATVINASRSTSVASTSAVPATPWENPSIVPISQISTLPLSPLISTSQDANLTLLTGTIFSIFLAIISFFSSTRIYPETILQWIWFLLAIIGGATALVFSRPTALCTDRKMGFLVGSTVLLFISNTFSSSTWVLYTSQAVLVGLSYFGVRTDENSQPSLGIPKGDHQHHHHHTEPYASRRELKSSKLTNFLLGLFRNWPLVHGILAEKDSRRIFYFMSLNFAFMIIQFSYGLATDSLGLLSDSIHMAFDCLALAVGLCAAVMSKWPPSVRFPYGYGKMDTLAGFANGIFLMLISIEIVAEAIERLAEGTDLKRLGELLIVSTIGLIVNLIGIMAFDHAHHGHGHSHGGHAHAHHHSHTHEEHSHSEDGHHDHPSGNLAHTHHHPSPDAVPATPSKPHAPHSHGHHHHHNSDNMHGIFLHILADTLGSVAVVISTLLVHFYGWSGFDPLASFFIAVLIFASAIPLVISSAKTLLLTVPADVEYTLRDTLAGVSGLIGVVGYSGPRFWVEGSGVPHDDELAHGHDGGHHFGEPRVLGVMHVVASRAADVEDVRERTVQFLRGRGMDVVVQVEREG